MDKTKDEIPEDDEFIPEMEGGFEEDIILIDLDILPSDDVSDDDAIDDTASLLIAHKQDGKHRLEYDSIFKGKKEEVRDDDEDYITTETVEGFEIDQSTVLYEEYRESERYLREKKVQEKVHMVLSEKTDLNFLNNRRKPSRSDFNMYYVLVKEQLREERFSNVEIFNELALYFSDNLFNMLKLLDNRWRAAILAELQVHVGRDDSGLVLLPRNIHEGTEVEFVNIDIQGKRRNITGVVTSANKETCEYEINSYENIYHVTFSDLVKILNNKHKYNLNMLNNIDFL